MTSRSTFETTETKSGGSLLRESINTWSCDHTVELKLNKVLSFSSFSYTAHTALHCVLGKTLITVDYVD